MASSADITERLTRTLEEFVEDWGVSEGITPQTTLVGDLEFDSIDVIQLVVAIESEFNNRKLGFQELLMREGRYVDDLSVAEISAFLETRLVHA